jgi:hypothetical protein
MKPAACLAPEGRSLTESSGFLPQAGEAASTWPVGAEQRALRVAIP